MLEGNFKVEQITNDFFLSFLFIATCGRTKCTALTSSGVFIFYGQNLHIATTSYILHILFSYKKLNIICFSFMPIYYNISVAEFLAREHGPVLFWLILPWNSHYLSLEEAGGGGGWVSGDFGYIT